MIFSSSLPPDSSPSPSPSLHPRPFSRLPIELLQHIIEFTVPFSFHSTTYVTRQVTLRSLCLVSRHFHQNAKPILFRVVELRESKALEQWTLVQCEGRPKCETKELVLGDPSKNSFTKINLAPFASLRVLVVNFYFDELALPVLSCLHNLSELRLVLVDLVATEPFSLPQLESIQLVDITSDRPIQQLFNPSTVPHLRALLIIDQEEELSDEVLLKLLEPLAAQLDLVSLLLDPFLTCSPSLLSKLAPKTLFEYGMRARLPKEVPIHHLRLYPTSTRPPRPDATPELLSRLASHLRNPARLPLLTSLYLPGLKTFISDDAPKLDDACAELSQVCRSRRIDLVFEEAANKCVVDSLMSNHFSRRMMLARRERHGL